MPYRIEFHPDAETQYQSWKTSDLRYAKKIDELLEDIVSNPFSGLGKPEQLKGGMGWSRRISKKDRLVYDVVEDLVIIYACCGHYK